jgi:hypothetical protein
MPEALEAVIASEQGRRYEFDFLDFTFEKPNTAHIINGVLTLERCK